MKIHNCLQNSPEWWELHRGRASASSFDRIITPKTMKLSAQADDLICELIAQTLLPDMEICPEGFISKAMVNGIMLEPEARRWYEFERGIEVTQVGFCETDDGRFGASPDALVGDDGLLELKCPLPKTHVRYLLDGELPSEYRCQVHGQLWVTGREWCDFVSYCPGMPRQFIVRVTPDDFTKALGACLEAFWDKFAAALERIERKAA